MRFRWLVLLVVPPALLACGNIEPEPAAPAAPRVAPTTSEAPRPPAAGLTAPSAAPATDGGPSVAATARADDLVPEWILETTKPLRTKLEACYTAGLAKAPTMVGTVMLSVGIDREGTMTASPTASEKVPPAVVGCVVGHLVKARYAPPKGQAPIVLSLPVHFHNNPTDGPSVTVGKRDPGY